MGRIRAVALGVTVVLVVTSALAGLSVAGVDLPGRWWAGVDDPERSAPRDPSRVVPPPGLSLPDPRAAVPVLGPASGPRTDAAAVRARLAPVLGDPDLGRHTGVIVRDLGRDLPVLTAGGADPYIPASTLKLFTTAAVLSELGPDHRFTTSVALAGADRAAGERGRPPMVVLVGGGDPLLSTRPPAPGEQVVPTTVSIAELAAATARSLRVEGIRRVRVGYDAALFVGPSAAPSWEPDYVAGDIVSPVSALWVDEGRVDPGGVERSADPALAAGATFVTELRRRGVRVVGDPVAAAAPEQADVIVRQSGARLDSVVAYVLRISDNEAAEVLLRHVALATDRPPSFSGGVAAVREVLTRLGVPYAGVRTYDGSGLSRANRMTRAALAQVLQLGADPDRPQLRTVTTGLPVAHFTGSLEYRFTAAETAAGRGVVRAKTGTLSHVHGLAGTVVTRDGTLLGFGLLTDEVPLVDTLDARALLDEMAAALAGCGCSR